MSKGYLYWIHLPTHTDITSQGYIGITKQAPSRRFSQHKRQARKCLNRGERLCPVQNAILKYETSMSVLVIADYDYILKLEEKLRPTKRVGWNVLTGGATQRPTTRGFNEAHLEGIRNYYVTHLHHTAHLQPWEIPAARATLCIWAKADEIYQMIQEGCGDSLITRRLGKPGRSTTVRSIRKLIATSNWNPSEDSVWVAHFKEGGYDQ